MLATNTNAKQTRYLVGANSNTPQTSVRGAPQTPGRVALWIQNTGANPGLVQFKNNIQGDGSDFTLNAGAFFPTDLSNPCPTEAINFGSILGTTFAVLELVERG